MESVEISEIEKYYNIELRHIIEDERIQSKVEFYKNQNTYSLNSKKEVIKINLKDNNLENLKGLSIVQTTITHLNLGATRIDNIKVLSNFKNLIFLDLSTNNIEDINPIKGLKKLEYLYLDNNKINKIPELNLPNLYELWLYSNNIVDITNLKYSLNLYSITLSNNKVENINVLGELKNLKVVDLRKNKISDINVLNNFKSLDSLNLSSNTINDISALSSFNNIKYLNLENNLIEDITSLKFIEIEKLFIGENNIIDLSSLYSSLKAKKIQFINVNNSPNLLYPTEGIAKGGEERIVEWLDMLFENVEKCKQKINDIKNNDIIKTSLDLGMMGLTDLSLIPELFELENLEELILSNEWAKFNLETKEWEPEFSKNKFYSNNIFNIPIEITKLKKLKKLIVGGRANAFKLSIATLGSYRLIKPFSFF
jgi:internalin A